jgi:hypothetical protein
MADEIEPHTVQHDLPAKPDVESRQETVERVVHEADDVQNVHARTESADPTSRRGVNRVLFRQAMVVGAIGAVVGAVLAIVLSYVTGPFQTDSAGAKAGYAVIMAVAIAIVFVLITTLIFLAREDGRVEREVEQKTGREPEPPGSPISPEHDIEDR